MNAWIEEAWKNTEKKICAQCQRVGSKVPYIAESGRYEDKMMDNPYWWTNGFWPGILWLVYDQNGNRQLMETAEKIEERLDGSLEGFEGLHHDVGFMWLLSSVLNYKLTGNPKSRIRGLHAATLLAGRFNLKGRFLRAWNKEFTGRMIVDSMMNLALLYWASSETGDPRFQMIAEAHAKTCMKWIVRPDGSCNHMIDFDPETGEYLDAPRGQGYAKGSSWSRGQAWALYGFTISYQHTKKQEFLDTACRVADYFLDNVQKTGYMPYVDFRMPPEPVKYDSTAGMIGAAGLLELAKEIGDARGTRYGLEAEALLKKAVETWCDWNPENDGILQMGTAEYHKETENHVPIIYGDYFMIETLLKLRGNPLKVW